jgi:peptide deformylase
VKYPVVHLGQPVLRSECDPVTSFGPDLAQLVADMFDVMYRAGGVGLAANQIGVGLRVFVFDCGEDGGHGEVGHVVNPTLVGTGGGAVTDHEGCLSLPGLTFPTPRADWAAVEGVDQAGRPVRYEGKGYVARCLQHECDHLDGTVYIDKLSGDTRRTALRAVREADWNR